MGISNMKYKKGTFVVVPNLEVLSGKPLEAQALFMWLCSYSNEDGVCFPSRKKLAQRCGFTVKTLDKYMKVLVSIGVVQKQIRKKEGTKENTSNLYQILINEEGSPLPDGNIDTCEDPTGSPQNNPVTISNSNYTNLTQLQPEVVQEVVAGNTLPLDRGKTPILRLLSIYKDCFRHLYGFSYKPNFGRDLKVFKELLEQYTELQLARLLVAYITWSDNGFLISTAYSIQVFKTYLPKLEAHVRNIEGEPFDDDNSNLTKVGEYFIKVINIDKVAIK
jgi:hypothetical protein